jgi:anti-sigma factor RsiW
MPWLLNGTLKPAERRKLEAHLHDCAACRAELERQRQLATLYWEAAPAAPEGDASAALARLAARLDAEAAPPARRSAPAVGWRIVAVLQFCVIAALAWTVLALRPDATEPDRQPAAYRGLAASASPASGDAVVFFAAEAAEIEIRRTLQRAGARIIDGPTAAGAYVLRFERDANEAALAALRRDRNVIRVEGLTAANASPSVAPSPRD